MSNYKAPAGQNLVAPLLSCKFSSEPRVSAIEALIVPTDGIL